MNDSMSLYMDEWDYLRELGKVRKLYDIEEPDNGFVKQEPLKMNGNGLREAMGLTDPAADPPKQSATQVAQARALREAMGLPPVQ